MSTPTTSPAAVPPNEKPSEGVKPGSTQPPVNVTPPNNNPNLAPGMPEQQFKVDDFVNYPGNADGTFGAGIGKVLAVEGKTVTVECDWQGKKHNTNFKEGDLTKAEK